MPSIATQICANAELPAVEEQIVLTDSIGDSFLHGQQALYGLADKLHRIRRELSGPGRGLPRIERVVRALASAEAMLLRPLRVAVMGESNSGKSTLTNLLLGNAIIPALQLPNTRLPTLLGHAAQPAVAAIMTDGRRVPLLAGAPLKGEMTWVEVGLPIAHLQACEIMDFPGFADPWLGYGSLDAARHRIDASIWCTFSTQAWKESERAAWRMLPQRMRSDAILVVTNHDLLRDEQANKVMARLSKITGGDFRAIAPLAALKALSALSETGAVADDALWQASGAADFLDALGGLLQGIRQHRLKRVQTFASGIAGKALDHLNALESS